MAIHWIMQTAWTVSKETGDIYSTNEPQIAFDFRITFCLNMQNEAGQALAVSALYAQGEGECREEERGSNRSKELAKHIAEEDDDDF